MGKDRSEADFDAFYVATARRVTHTVYAMTADLAEAQDCTQEAYARAWQRWSTVGEYADPEAWVRTVARRIAVSRWRRTKTGARAMVRHGGPAPSRAPSEDHVALVGALRQIPQAQRHAVVLHHLVGRSVEEIAVEMGVPTGTVKARLHRGRAALATLLALTPPGGIPSAGRGRREVDRGR
ncbi:MAG: SigE family RNA polymerase sigma factor [Actinomycetales bacterium]|nr:SigE family RNA polymerase sigma factor [Actinomycetales bacterium]